MSSLVVTVETEYDCDLLEAELALHWIVKRCPGKCRKAHVFAIAATIVTTAIVAIPGVLDSDAAFATDRMPDVERRRTRRCRGSGGSNAPRPRARGCKAK